jgi:serine/threonine protein kinase
MAGGLENFSAIKFLGSGKVCQVFEIADIHAANKRLVLKLPIFFHPNPMDFAASESYIRFEIEILKSLSLISDTRIAGHFPKLITYGKVKDLLKLSIPQIDSYRHFPDSPFILQEFAQGVSLDDYAQSSQLTEGDFVEIFEQLICFFQALFENEIVYRDVKLNHIFWDSQNRNVQLIDWNIVQIKADECYGLSFDKNESLQQLLQEMEKLNMHEILKKFIKSRAG